MMKSPRGPLSVSISRSVGCPPRRHIPATPPYYRRRVSLRDSPNTQLSAVSVSERLSYGTIKDPFKTQRHSIMWIKLAMLAAGLIAVAAGALPFISSSMSGDENASVMTQTVRKGDLVVTVTENGMLESSNNEEIKCMVKGGSTVLWVIETGTFVKPGDELVRLDTSLIEDNITQQQINYERAVANQIIAQSEVDVAETNIEEYVNGTYLEERNTIEKQIFDAEELVNRAQLSYESATRMASKGMFRTLQLEGEKFAVDSARKDLELKKKQLETLDIYKKKKTLQGLSKHACGGQSSFGRRGCIAEAGARSTQS